MAQIVHAGRPAHQQVLPAGPAMLALDYATAPSAARWFIDGVELAATSTVAELLLPVGSVVVRCRAAWSVR